MWVVLCFVFFGVFLGFCSGFAPRVGVCLCFVVVCGDCVYHTFSTVEFLFFRKCSRVVVCSSM